MVTGNERVVQNFELQRQHEGMVQIAKLTTTTDPPTYTTDESQYFAADQVP
jgi:hypothetical protein